MARDLDALSVLFPFEVACYADTKLPVEFVGHPFVASDYVSRVRYDPAGPVLLLPGSRKQAVAQIFPVLLRGFAAYGKREAVVLYPSETVRDVLRAANPPANVRLQPMGTSTFAMYPEFIQGAATPEALAAELKACVEDPARAAKTAEQAARLRGLLSQPAGGTAADWLARRV